MPLLLDCSRDQFGVEIIAMQRRANWKPVIVPNGHRAENGTVNAKGRATGDEDRLVDIRFTIGAALALGLPALIGVALHLAVTPDTETPDALTRVAFALSAFERSTTRRISFRTLVVRSPSAVASLAQTKSPRASPDCDISDELSDRVDAYLSCSRCALAVEPVDAPAHAFERPSLLRGSRALPRAASIADRCSSTPDLVFSYSSPRYSFRDKIASDSRDAATQDCAWITPKIKGDDAVWSRSCQIANTEARQPHLPVP